MPRNITHKAKAARITNWEIFRLRGCLALFRNLNCPEGVALCERLIKERKDNASTE